MTKQGKLSKISLALLCDIGVKVDCINRKKLILTDKLIEVLGDHFDG